MLFNPDARSSVPTHRDIQVTPTSIHTRNIHASGRNTESKFEMIDGVLWIQVGGCNPQRLTVVTPLLRKLLNDNQ